MSSSYEPAPVLRFPRLTRRTTGETRFWRKFKFPVVGREGGAVTSITACAASPHDVAVTAGPRVQVYGARTSAVKKTIQRFDSTAFSGVLRDDGKLLAAGCETPIVQIFDMSSRTVLRKLDGHDRAVHVVKFAPGQQATRLFSGSDDTTVRCWNIAEGKEEVKLTGHSDYVRCGALSSAGGVSGDVFISGSYDHSVRLWDVRSGSGVLSMDHGVPVESVLALPGGGLVLSAGGDTIKVWDVFGGGRLLQSFSNHHKTITSLCTDSTGRRLISGGLDRHVKIYDTSDFRVVHSLKYSAPILSVALTPDDMHLFVGMSTGLLSMRHRASNREVGEFEGDRIQHSSLDAIFPNSKPSAGADTETNSLRRNLRAGTYRYFVRGKNYKPSADEVTVDRHRKRRLRKYDQFLRKFQYQNALDAVLEPGHRPIMIVSVLEEIVRRGGLRIALAGRDTASLQPLLHFLVKQVSNPRFAPLLIDVCNAVFDIYAPVVGHSMKIDELFMKLKRKVDEEITFQRSMQELLGAMDMILAGAAH